MLTAATDAADCRHWRSETLTALTSQQAFKARRNRYMTMLTEDLAAILSVVVPKVALAELQASLRRSILEPAAGLAHRLHLATNVYTIRWPARSPWSRLEVYDCFNLANGGTVLDLSGTTSTSPSRRNVSYMFDIAPGLFVERVEGNKRLAMKAVHKPSVLVHGGQGDVVQRSTLMRWVWDSSDGLPNTVIRPTVPKSELRSLLIPYPDSDIEIRSCKTGFARRRPEKLDIHVLMHRDQFPHGQVVESTII
jgi:hypothetical protein